MRYANIRFLPWSGLSKSHGWLRDRMELDGLELTDTEGSSPRKLMGIVDENADT